MHRGTGLPPLIFVFTYDYIVSIIVDAGQQVYLHGGQSPLGAWPKSFSNRVGNTRFLNRHSRNVQINSPRIIMRITWFIFIGIDLNVGFVFFCHSFT